MSTPIYDFIKHYNERGDARMHMPGHKGVGELGEAFDITEVRGADSLYEASGIIAESERLAGEIFGARTFYSTEGSSLAIRATVYLISLYAKSVGRRPLIFAARNAHKSFISAVSLTDAEVEWLVSESDSYLSSGITPEGVRRALSEAKELPAAVYLTSPDYLGNIADVRKIGEACHEFGVLLAVDCAHGAYLRFLDSPMHPMELGADIACASAHKTLPVLTGGAYLHISNDAPKILAENARVALSLFGSTSPSYLILASLDRFNDSIPDFRGFIKKIDEMKATLTERGYRFVGDEPMKITIDAKDYGYLGTELADEMADRGVEIEFADPDFIVFMPSPLSDHMALGRLYSALLTTPKRAKITTRPPSFVLPERILSPREAMLAERESLPIAECVGRVLAATTVGCPPAVPIAVAGERISREIAEVFDYYGHDRLTVVK